MSYTVTGTLSTIHRMNVTYAVPPPTTVPNEEVGTDVPPGCEPPSITGFVSLGDNYPVVGVPYSLYIPDIFPLVGSVPRTWAVVSGALPTGLSISGEYITGTPTASGTFTYGLSVTNACGTDLTGDGFQFILE